MNRLWLALGLLGLLLGGCAQTISEGAVSGAADQGDGPNWHHPIWEGIEVSDVAQAKLPFDPNEPDGLGSPERIVVTSPGSVPVAQLEIVWVYDHPSYGIFNLVQHPVERSTTEAEFAELASQTPGCTEIPATAEDEANLGVGVGPRIECHAGAQSLTLIRGGVPALLHEGTVATAVHWLEPLTGSGIELIGQRFSDPALEVVVIGPAESLTPQEALEIASLV